MISSSNSKFHVSGLRIFLLDWVLLKLYNHKKNIVNGDYCSVQLILVSLNVELYEATFLQFRFLKFPVDFSLLQT